MSASPATLVTLKLATPADADMLDLYLRDLRRDDPMPAHAFADETIVRSALRQLLSDNTVGRIWLILNNATPAGYLALTFVFSLEFGGRCAFIDELFIDRAHRGAGIGKAA